MKVILLQNTIYKGKRLLAGACVDMEEEIAKKFISTKLAYAEEVVKPAEAEPAEAEPAEAEAEPATKAKKKKVAK